MCDCEIFSCIESLFRYNTEKTQHKTRKRSPQQTIYQRVSMLLSPPDFSFQNTCESIFPKSEDHYPTSFPTQHALLPIVITKDGVRFKEKRPRKVY